MDGRTSDTPRDRDGSGPHAGQIAGEEVLFDPSGVVFWPAECLLVVADLHLEKASSHAERGIFLPPYDTGATLAALAAAIARYEPRTVLCLGDSFHDRRADGRMDDLDRERIAALQAGRVWVWISGNHDPLAPAGLAGEACDELALGPLTFRHQPAGRAMPGEVAGHLHPSARIRQRGRTLRRRCFAGDGARLVLPAFGAFTGGLNVLDEAWKGIFAGRRFNAYMLGASRVFAMPGRVLLHDRFSRAGGVTANGARTAGEGRIPEPSE